VWFGVTFIVSTGRAVRYHLRYGKLYYIMLSSAEVSRAGHSELSWLSGGLSDHLLVVALLFCCASCLF
jgi:hypothetical protein